MTGINLNELMAVAYIACKKAGDIIKGVAKSGDLHIKDKQDADYVNGRAEDPQTEADRRAEALIARCFEYKFPGLKLVGEEGIDGSDCADWSNTFQDSLPDSINQYKDIFAKEWTLPDTSAVVALKDVTVWIDPLDGTRDFVEKRYECVTTLIGITVGKHSIAGVIFRPFCDEAIIAHVDIGAYMLRGDDMQGITHVNDRIVHDEVLRVTTSASRSSKELDASIRRLTKVVTPQFKSVEVIKAGGAGYKFWMLLVGEADVYYYPKGGMSMWDICAGDAALRAIGGRLTDPAGNEFLYKSPDQIVTNGLIGSVLPDGLHAILL